MQTAEHSEPLGDVIDCEVEPDTELADRAAAVIEAEAERFREVSVRCPQCESRATVTRTESGAGFIIIAMSGMPHDTVSFGISDAGLPICPNEGAGMLPIEAKPIADAMAEAQGQLDGAVQAPLFAPPPFDLHHAFAEIIKQQQRVTSKRTAWEDAKKEAKEAKDSLDDAAELLENMIAKAASDEREAIALGQRVADPTVAEDPDLPAQEKQLSELQEIASLRLMAANDCSCDPDADEPQRCPACAATDKLIALGVLTVEEELVGVASVEGDGNGPVTGESPDGAVAEDSEHVEEPATRKRKSRKR